jgi:hypothetical protein
MTVDFSNLEKVQNAVRDTTKLVRTETPVKPLVKAQLKIAKK